MVISLLVLLVLGILSHLSPETATGTLTLMGMAAVVVGSIDVNPETKVSDATNQAIDELRPEINAVLIHMGQAEDLAPRVWSLYLRFLGDMGLTVKKDDSRVKKNEDRGMWIRFVRRFDPLVPFTRDTVGTVKGYRDDKTYRAFQYLREAAIRAEAVELHLSNENNLKSHAKEFAADPKENAAIAGRLVKMGLRKADNKTKLSVGECESAIRQGAGDPAKMDDALNNYLAGEGDRKKKDVTEPTSMYEVLASVVRLLNESFGCTFNNIEAVLTKEYHWPAKRAANMTKKASEIDAFPTFTTVQNTAQVQYRLTENLKKSVEGRKVLSAVSKADAIKGTLAKSLAAVKLRKSARKSA